MASDKLVTRSMRVAGVSFHQADVENIRVSDCVILVPELDNVHDQHAIRIDVLTHQDGTPSLAITNVTIGHIPAECCLLVKEACFSRNFVGALIEGLDRPNADSPIGVRLKFFFTKDIMPKSLYPKECHRHESRS